MRIVRYRSGKKSTSKEIGRGEMRSMGASFHSPIAVGSVAYSASMSVATEEDGVQDTYHVEFTPAEMKALVDHYNKNPPKD